MNTCACPRCATRLPDRPAVFNPGDGRPHIAAILGRTDETRAQPKHRNDDAAMETWLRNGWKP